MFKYRGRIDPSSRRHALKSQRKPGDLIAPRYVHNEWTQESDIPQYAPTIVGSVQGYAPTDCEGAFMPFKFQANNNCYAYACRIATNSYPQPGRASRGSSDLRKSENYTPAHIQQNAELDGLVHLGTELRNLEAPRGQGHLVALLFSPAVSNIGGDPLANWAGDYHWVRCDDAVGRAPWSQKDGGGAVTDFDFAGQPITDPALANWTVNYGPVGQTQDARSTDDHDFQVTYKLVCFMWVPRDGVHII